MKASPKTKGKPEKVDFVSTLQKNCEIYEYNKIPLCKILSAEPKPGLPLQTYPPNIAFNSNEHILIYLAYENFVKDGSIDRVIIKDTFFIDELFLNAFQETLQTYSTITVLKLENCHLSYDDVIYLHKVLMVFETIVDLSLDGNPNQVQNFFILLKNTNLQYLSLQRCRINEYGLKHLSRELNGTFNEPLLHLNLNGNFIDDKGLEHLIQALRENRTLLSLSIADNWISDRGFCCLMEVFQKFALNHRENLIRREINLNYFVQRACLKEQYKAIRNEFAAPPPPQNQKNRTVTSAQSKRVSLNYITEEQYLENNLQKSEHPFVKDSIPENGEIYCPGNFKLSYLNIAHNKITPIGLKCVVDTLIYQHSFEVDGGLLFVVLDGNECTECPELWQIKNLLLLRRWGTLHKEGSKPKLSKRSIMKYNATQNPV